MKLAIPLLTLSLLVSGCSTYYKVKSWPEEIPSRSYFTDYYAQDTENQRLISEKEYLVWIHRFYYGWELYRRGWLRATDELVSTIDEPHEKVQARETSTTIGQLVAPEWAKNPNYRVINTRHLIIWGNALNESMIRDEQILILNQILSDVKALLDGDIKPKELASNRYYEPEEFGQDEFEF